MSGWTFDDGGREAAGFRGQTRDCVTRAIAIATEIPYREVYDELTRRQKAFAGRRGDRRYKHDTPQVRQLREHAAARASARLGVNREAYEPFLLDLGWTWTPLLQIGQAERVHLVADELPGGRIICALSRHLSAVVDGVIHDTFDPSRGGRRMVYGLYRR